MIVVKSIRQLVNNISLSARDMVAKMNITKPEDVDMNTIINVAKFVAERDSIPDFPEGLAKALAEERAFLFQGEDGFFVLEPILYRGCNAVNVLLAHSKGIHGVLRYIDLVVDLAQRINSSFIVGYTRHERVFRAYERVGFVRRGVNSQGLQFFVKDLR